jgi:hypothetical protein
VALLCRVLLSMWGIRRLCRQLQHSLLVLCVVVVAGMGSCCCGEQVGLLGGSDSQMLTSRGPSKNMGPVCVSATQCCT